MVTAATPITFPALNQSASAAVLTDAAREAISAAYEWALLEIHAEGQQLAGATSTDGGGLSLVNGRQLDASQPIRGGGGAASTFSLRTSPVSIHIPLHRFAAVLINAAVVANNAATNPDHDGRSGDSPPCHRRDTDTVHTIGDASECPAVAP